MQPPIWDQTYMPDPGSPTGTDAPDPGAEDVDVTNLFTCDFKDQGGAFALLETAGLPGLPPHFAPEYRISFSGRARVYCESLHRARPEERYCA